jgi:mRNA interferase MazF
MVIKQGTIIKINFHPAIGSEQAGYRPAVVVSNNFMLSMTNIIMVAPITSTYKPFPTRIPLDDQTKTTGYVLCEHAKAMDLKKRQYVIVEELPKEVLKNVLDTINRIFEPSE